MKKNKKHEDNVELVFGPILYANHLRAFLGADQYVTVDCDARNKLINVVVTGCQFKAECLASILITTERLEELGEGIYNLDGYRIAVNGQTEPMKMKVTQKVISAALAGNEYFKGIEKHTIKLPNGKSMSRWFGMLNPKVVQAPVDNFGNPFGMDSFVAEDFIKFAFNDKTRKVVAWTTDRK